MRDMREKTLKGKDNLFLEPIEAVIVGVTVIGIPFVVVICWILKLTGI